MVNTRYSTRKNRVNIPNYLYIDENDISDDQSQDYVTSQEYELDSEEYFSDNENKKKKKKITKYIKSNNGTRTHAKRQRQQLSNKEIATNLYRSLAFLSSDELSSDNNDSNDDNELFCTKTNYYANNTYKKNNNEKTIAKVPKTVTNRSNKRSYSTIKVHKFTLDEVEELLNVWEDNNEIYAKSLNDFITKQLKNISDYRIAIQRIDVEKLYHLSDFFKEIFNAMFGYIPTDYNIDDAVSALQSIINENALKLIIIVDGWTKLICSPSVIISIQSLLSVEKSPYIFVLQSQMCQDLVLRKQGLKSATFEKNNECIILFPLISIEQNGTQFSDYWFYILFDKFIITDCNKYLEEKKKKKDNNQNSLLPSSPCAWIFGNQLSNLKHLPKKKYQLESAVPPLKCLIEIRDLAYNNNLMMK